MKNRMRMAANKNAGDPKKKALRKSNKLKKRTTTVTDGKGNTVSTTKFNRKDAKKFKKDLPKGHAGKKQSIRKTKKYGSTAKF